MSTDDLSAIERTFDAEGRAGVPDPVSSGSWDSVGGRSSVDLRETAERAVRALVDLERADEFLACLSPDVTWRIPGDWPGISGVKDRAGVERFVHRGMPAGFPEGLEIELHAVHCAGGVAVVEFTGRARTSRGRSYENEYCFVLEFRDGMVLRIREYMDTSYADSVLHTD